MPIGARIRCDLSHIRLRPVLLALRAITGAGAPHRGPGVSWRGDLTVRFGNRESVWSGVVAALTVIIAMAALYLPILAR